MPKKFRNKRGQSENRTLSLRWGVPGDAHDESSGQILSLLDVTGRDENDKVRALLSDADAVVVPWWLAIAVRTSLMLLECAGAVGPPARLPRTSS